MNGVLWQAPVKSGQFFKVIVQSNSFSTSLFLCFQVMSVCRQSCGRQYDTHHLGMIGVLSTSDTTLPATGLSKIDGTAGVASAEEFVCAAGASRSCTARIVAGVMVGNVAVESGARGSALARAAAARIDVMAMNFMTD